MQSCNCDDRLTATRRYVTPVRTRVSRMTKGEGVVWECNSNVWTRFLCHRVWPTMCRHMQTYRGGRQDRPSRASARSAGQQHDMHYSPGATLLLTRRSASRTWGEELLGGASQAGAPPPTHLLVSIINEAAINSSNPTLIHISIDSICRICIHLHHTFSLRW